MTDSSHLWGQGTRRRVGLSRALLLILVASGLLISAGSIPAASVHAQALQPRILALKRSAFPAGATVKSGPATSMKANSASALHSVPFDSLDRIGGYLQSARWTVGRTKLAVTMQYLASIFSSDIWASTATTDARATLWQVGQAISLSSVSSPGFLVAERGKHIEAFAVVSSGPIEVELSVRFPASLDSRSRSSILRLLGRDAATTILLAKPFVTSGPTFVDPNAIPPIAVAPWGTGPVVKSPSLMAIGAPGVGGNLAASPGLFRASTPALPSRTESGVPPPSDNGLTQFVREAAMPDRTELYNSTTLFGDAQGAAATFDRTAAAMGGRTWLRTVDVQSYLSTLPYLKSADAVRAWESNGETIVLVCRSNVILVLAAARGNAPESLMPLANTITSTIPTSLHTQATAVVDAAGMPAHLAGLNWYGTEQRDFVVGGLDYRRYQDILTTIKQLGYNSIRLPISNQVVEQNPIVTAHVAANPDLAGMHTLDILDRIVNYAGALGLRVILDDHRSDAGWSSEENGLWYTPDYPDSAFVRDWAAIAQRYAVNDVVTAADLRNEPHGTASWGDGNPATDWRAAAARAGDAALAQNPNLLIVVEGVQYYGQAPGYWWGGNLMGVAAAPVSLQFADGSSAQNRLVYSAHDYGKDNCGVGCPWFNSATSYATLSALWDQYWGYIGADPSKPYAAPVWVGEFGTCNYQQDCVSGVDPGSQGQWFSSLTRYIAERHLSWCYWSANGTQSTAPTRNYGDLDWYGLLGRDWLAPGPWIHNALRPIQADVPTTGSDRVTLH